MPHRGDAACCVSTTFNNGLAKAVLLRPHHHNSRVEADRDLICICRTTGGGKVDAVHKRTGAAVRFGSYVERVGVLRSEEHTSELQSRFDLVCRLLLEKKKHDCIVASIAHGR